ncbi:MAG: hypothetical protein LWX83_08390 [Anaerolineae bacterium]|nr:hypothetical protein [Anaerolineae bacterium]
MLVVGAVISQTHPEIINLSAYLGGEPGGQKHVAAAPVPATLPTTMLQTEISRLQTETFSNTQVSTDAPAVVDEPSVTPEMILSATEMDTATPEATLTPDQSQTPTSTLPPTVTATNIPSFTPTFTASPTIYPYSLTAYNSTMSTPLQGIGFGELPSIISQLYNVPDPLKDTGHHGVDLGSYDYHGKLIYDWPIQAVFAGKVVGIIIDRPPIGNTIILESTYNELPPEVIQLKGIKQGQSLYHMYSHMLNPPTLKIGDRVILAQEIGRVGKSQTVEAHLHLEMVIGVSGQTFSSMAYYNANATEDEKKEYMYWRTSGTFVAFDPMELFANLK